MFIALDEHGNRTPIESAGREADYYCPLCGEKVTVKKKGEKKAPHFAHKIQSDCTDWGDMSEWHRTWQECFPMAYREAVMEKDGEKHRADICIEEEKLVIEFQHSPISAEEFNRRNLFYTECGYRLIWVFDAENKIQVKDGLLEWKRRQSAFDGFDNRLRNITVYLEADIAPPSGKKRLLLLKSLSRKLLEEFPLIYPVYRENFLKEYGAIPGEGVLSIRDIWEETKEYRKEQERVQKAQLSRRVDQALRAMTRGSRHRGRRF